MWLARGCFSILAVSILLASYANAGEINAADEDEYMVLQRGDAEITIDAKLDDWRLAENVLLMGADTWEPWEGGEWDNKDDLTARLRVVYDRDNLYFALLVKDDEYVAEAGNPWENDGVQMAINSITQTFPPAAGLQADTHLYNFSINEGWLAENGTFMGPAEIEMLRYDDTKETIFEWCMNTDIFDEGLELQAGQKIAFAIIINDSDEDAKGQKGWVGWGNHTIVHGKSPEEMQTLILSFDTLAVDAISKLTTTWGALK